MSEEEASKKVYYIFEKSIRFHEIFKLQNSANLLHIYFFTLVSSLFYFSGAPKVDYCQFEKNRMRSLQTR